MKKAFQYFIIVQAILALGLLASGCLSRPALVRQDFVLPTPSVANPAATRIGGVLALNSCEVSPPFAGKAFVYRIGPNAFETDPYAGFLVPADQAFAIAIRAWFDHSGLFASVLEPDSSAPADQSLEVYVHELYGDLRVPSRPQAVLSLSFVFIDAKKENGTRVIFHKEYSRHLPVSQNTAAAIVAGWSQALDEIMRDVASDLAAAHKQFAQNRQP